MACYNWEIGPDFAPPYTPEQALYQKFTRPKELFLSRAVQLNHQGLRPLFAWFREALTIVFPQTFNPPIDSPESLDWVRSHRAKLIRFMQLVDHSISDIEVIDTDQILIARSSFSLNLEQESRGVQKWFALAPDLFKWLDNGGVLAIDGLEQSLHPMLLMRFIAWINNPQINQHHSQLIFSTQDSVFFNHRLLRPDQIYFMEKADHQSRLYSLASFPTKTEDDFEKNYMQGRYGAVPIVDF